MKLFRQLDQLPAEYRGGCISIGNFDGVHRGHARIMERVRHHADLVNGPAVVFTFDPHPVRILRPELAPPPLTWTNRKADLLTGLGIDAIIAYPTNRQLLALTAEQFFQQIIVDSLQARAIVEGPNFYFGKDRKGDVDILKELCAGNGIEVEIVQPLVAGDRFVSSSRIREEIIAGNLAAANELLTSPYRIRGMVMHGAGRGATIGVPTANIAGIDTLLPLEGVYAGNTWHDGTAWPSAINIGPNPTFGEVAKKVEVHLIGFSDFIYGQTIEVDIHARIRDVQTFGGIDDLKRQLALDISAALQIANG